MSPPKHDSKYVQLLDTNPIRPPLSYPTAPRQRNPPCPFGLPQRHFMQLCEFCNSALPAISSPRAHWRGKQTTARDSHVNDSLPDPVRRCIDTPATRGRIPYCSACVVDHSASGSECNSGNGVLQPEAPTSYAVPRFRASSSRTIVSS